MVQWPTSRQEVTYGILRSMTYCSMSHTSMQEVESRRRKVCNYEPFVGCNVDTVNILVIGRIRSGKSSFFNSLDTAISGKLKVRAGTGSAITSLTKVVGLSNISLSMAFTLFFLLLFVVVYCCCC